MNATMHAPAAPPLTREQLEQMAHGLVAQARASGFNLEISPRPLQPLAMRNFELAITVWPFRP